MAAAVGCLAAEPFKLMLFGELLLKNIQTTTAMAISTQHKRQQRHSNINQTQQQRLLQRYSNSNHNSTNNIQDEGKHELVATATTATTATATTTTATATTATATTATMQVVDAYFRLTFV